MTEPLNKKHKAAAVQPYKEADDAFLRRILFGLIAAAAISGAVTLALTSQYDFISERFEVAGTYGPA